MHPTKLFVFVVMVSLFILFFYFDLNRYFDLNFLVSKKQEWDVIYHNSPLWCLFIFFVFYVFCTALSIPGAVVLTLAGGFLFGFVTGSLVSSFSSTIGATVAFLASRFLFKDVVQKTFHSRLQHINAGFKKDGAFYLFSLRLIPLVPFFLLNILMGLTPISLKRYVIVSFLGMLPGTLVYVNAGTQLAHVKSIEEILSLPIVLSFCLLASLPWLMKYFLKHVSLGKTILQ